MPTKDFKQFSHILSTKCCSNKFHFLLSAFIATCLLGQCYGGAAAKKALQAPQGPHECESLDIRNECSNFKLLENCTVIKGFLVIALLPKEKTYANGTDSCNWKEQSFPLLREITDYLILYHVKGLTTLRYMFPNLTVIRGRRLFLNYAIGITEMPDLEVIEFKSLVAVQRGHVFIGTSPKLCHLKNINWNRLTLTTGVNHIFPVSTPTCKTNTTCLGCKNLYCWSNKACQKFENDNLLNVWSGTMTCDEQCLGGCNKTATDCAVCRGLTDHGKCVKECPADKLQHEHSQRCYTPDECINEMGSLIHEGNCVSHCPSGLKPSANRTCAICSKDEKCDNVCQSPPEGYIAIYSLRDADQISGCDIINSTLFIIIRSKINETDLEHKFSRIREIRGHLKVYRSRYLTSLAMFNNLEKVGGTPSENGHFSLIIYSNNNLKQLWSPKPHFELERGGMYIHLNNKLCNHHIMEFSNAVIHDHDKDSIQESDQEVLCGPVKLLLDIQVLSHRKLLFSWFKENTYEKIEIMYRPVMNSELFQDESELDTPVCERINWHRELILQDEVHNNGTHLSYAIDGLNQNSKYACLVKTFGSSYAHTARSDLVFMTTKADIPPPPKIEILKKTNVSLTIQLNSDNNTNLNYMIDHYLLEVYEKPDDVHYLDKRNFCQNPAYLSKDILTEVYTNSAYNEDFDDCCARLENSLEDERFMADIEAEFSCSLDRTERCRGHGKDAVIESTKNGIVKDLRLGKNESLFKLDDLKPFRLYVLMFKACNEVGCSSFSMRSERTNYTREADLVDELDGCHMPNSTEYRVFFTEPKNPNGVIVSYVVHFRRYIPKTDRYHSHISCVTRVEHKNAKNLFVRHINFTYDEVAVRAHSLAGDTITNWLPMTSCDPTAIAASTKLAGFDNNKEIQEPHSSRRGLNIFLIFFLIGCAGTALWVCYKRRYWRHLPELRQLFSFNRTQIPQILINRDESSQDEDRQILVDNFETVRFQNRPFEDDDNDDTTVSSMSE